MNAVRTVFLVGLAEILILVFPAAASAAPRLYLDPATATVVAGAQTTLNLMIDTSNQKAAGADATLTFPKATIQAVTITPGSFFGIVNNTISNQTGSAGIHGYFATGSQTESKSGIGVVATIALKGVAPGTAAISIPCTSGLTTDANIADEAGRDIIVCSGVLGTEISVIAAGGDASAATPTPTPSVLPDAGGITQTIGLFGFGLLLIISGGLLVTVKRITA